MFKMANDPSHMFKKELNRVERIGIREVAKEWLLSRFDAELGSALHFTALDDEHEILNSQFKGLEVEEGITLSHFAMTDGGAVVAVCFDEEDEYVFYGISL
jgi:hypothetical protein